MGCVLSLLEMSEAEEMNDFLELLISLSGQKGVYVTRYKDRHLHFRSPNTDG